MSAPAVPRIGERASWARVLSALEDRGLVTRRRGDEHLDARCPAHDDGRASLTADYQPGDPGRTLLRCHAGCEFGELVAALGLAERDTFDGPSRDGGRVPRPRRAPAARTEALRAAPARVKCARCRWAEVEAYRYTDRGEVVLEVVRQRCDGCGRKNFPVRRPDGRGGWEWRWPVKRPLYRADEVRAAVADGRTVYVVEGEKDVHAAELAGLVATCNPGGAGKWRPAHSALIAGAAQVVIVCDRDRAGYRHAADVSAALAGGVHGLTVVEPAAGNDLSDHLEAGLGVDGLVPVPAARLAELTERAEPDGNVAQLRDRRGGGAGRPPGGGAGDGTGGGSPTPAGLPPYSVPMSRRRGDWRYALGDDGWRRGVYEEAELRAPLPYCHALVVRRDGTGSQVATEFLLSAAELGPRKMVGHLAVHDGSWANELGLALSDDPTVVQATATAIRDMAHRDAPEREAVPRIGDDGRVGVPVPECLPVGYLVCAPGDRVAGLEAWRRVAQIAAAAPKLADLIGASAFAPFMRPLRRQAHWQELYGEPGQGKTTALSLAASVWGAAVTDEQAVLLSWNATSIGLSRHLGSLGILPAFLDEQGMAGFAPSDWGELIFKTTEGNQRGTAERKSIQGTNRSLPWGGVLFTSGNGRVTAGLGAGKFAGLLRRVVSVASPFTSSAVEAEALAELVEGCYGHLGAELLERFGLDDARRVLEECGPLVGELPADAVPRTLAKHLHSHVAGAALADEVLGTGTALRDAAAEFARGYLAEHGVTPEHDADRIIAAIREAMAREPASWPTRAEYVEHLKAPASGQFTMAPGRVELPQRGMAREFAGVRADDGSWVAVFPEPFHAETASQGVDETLALAELYRRGVLLVARSARAEGKWLTRVRLEERPAPPVAMYKLTLPELDDDEEEVTGPGDSLARAPVYVIGADSPGTPGTPQVKPQIAPGTPPGTHREPHREPRRETAHPVPLSTSERFAAPAVVADIDGAYLARCDRLEALELVELGGLGDVAEWAAGLRLGVEHGAGLPDDAVAVILPRLAGRLGLPASAPDPKSKKGREHATLAELEAAGWRVKGARVLSSWMTVYRPGGRDVRLWLPGWDDEGQCPMWAEGLDAVTLAYRLGLFAAQLGIGWRLTGGITGVDLAKTFPRKTLRLGQADPPKPAGAPLEMEFVWGRSPMSDEGELGWLHCYDGNGAYTSAYNTPVNVGGWRHAEAPEFDPKLPGYWLVDPPDWADRLLPDPFDPTGRAARTGRAGAASWRATPTLAGLAELGYDIRPREAWLPDGAHGRWWEPWYERVRDARAALLAMPGPDAEAVLEALKSVWHATHGQITTQTQGKRRDHDHTIIAAYRANLLRRLVKVGEAERRWPLAIATDNVAYASADPDPRAACPAGMALGTGLGQFKIAGVLPMADALPLLGTGRGSDLTDGKRGLFALARKYLSETGQGGQ